MVTQRRPSSFLTMAELWLQVRGVVNAEFGGRNRLHKYPVREDGASSD